MHNSGEEKRLRAFTRVSFQVLISTFKTNKQTKIYKNIKKKLRQDSNDDDDDDDDEWIAERKKARRRC